jgi:PilZ domain
VASVRCILGGRPLNRRSLTPSIGTPVPGLPPTRRTGGARRTVSYRVTFVRGDVEIPGWALNLSRGGLRAVIEERVELGEELGVRIDEIQVERRGRVVWTQDEPDGAIVGVSFLERIEAPPPGVELDSSAEIEPATLAARLGLTVAQLRAALDDTDPAASPGEPKPKEKP